MKLLFVLITPILLCTSISCKKIEPGNDPNFTIVKNEDKDFKKFDKKVEVFGIPIYAKNKLDNSKLLHAANVMAQYLDNDEDGNIDNPLVLETMINSGAYMVMWSNKTNLIFNRPNNKTGQDLGEDETVPNWHSNGQTGRFDASLEEVWHIITHAGYSNAYPEIFGEQAGSSLCNAMDLARGGQYTNIPSPYPPDAWYTYDDETCGYDCMATEYFYWAMTSILGAQVNRLDEISQEWDLNTRSLVQSQDPIIYNLLTDPKYAFPTILPDGTYKH